ncbi:MAG: single-stranded-DNA-specific exonuclease RecJ [Gaiellales bacterium]
MGAIPPRFQIAACPADQADALAAALDLHRPTAEALVRRGLADPDAAREFLELDGSLHDPLLLGDMPEACELIGAAVAARSRICVHGDYDADGICATALAVGALQALGADVAWHLPSRFDEGYGLAAETVERLAADGVSLLLTVDCGITAVDQVARARELGMDVIVTDHHTPGRELPDCPRVCPRPSAYPFGELCGTGVAFKLAQALFSAAGRDPAELDDQLDLVALATVADVVPLVDENRGLVRAGLRRLARTPRQGLDALMKTARVDRVNVSAGDIGFRLAPRINAAGRLCHPAEALELLLTGDAARARELAERLEGLNRQRQAVEDDILRDAVARVDEATADWRAQRAYVLASRDWHEGVIGIVASRLVERYGRPVVLIAVGDDEAKGSGRSIPAYDLHAGLTACGGHLVKYGGHRAAAGLTIAPDAISAFASALAAHAEGVVSERDLAPRHRIDAILAPAEVSLELADELTRLEPFGLGNPAVTMLAPGATLHAVERMGEGKHLRCAVELGGYRCRAVGFGMGSAADGLRGGGRMDVAYRVQRNQWNGTVTPQMVLRAVTPSPAGMPPPGHDPTLTPACETPRRARVIDDRGCGVQISTIARLAAGGEPVLVLVADAGRRAAMLCGPLHPGRLGGGTIALASYDEAAMLEDAAARFGRVVALDPPADPEQGALLAELGSITTVHLVWGAAEIEFARSVAESREPLRPALVAVWRADKAGNGQIPLATDTLERCRTVLAEIGLNGKPHTGGKLDLSASATYRQALERVESIRRFLASDQIAV